MVIRHLYLVTAGSFIVWGPPSTRCGDLLRRLHTRYALRKAKGRITNSRPTSGVDDHRVHSNSLHLH